jgi:hypothetical protein
MDGHAGKAAISAASASVPAPAPASASVNFRAYVVQAMDRIEAARHAGVLMYPEDYVKKHASEALSPEQVMMLGYGATTHLELFEQYRGSYNPLLNFRLKAMVSASDALDTLLDSGETVLDCGAVCGLAYQLAARMAFEARHGKDLGRLRFDYLWGSASVEVPKVQRLLITNNGMVAGTVHYRTAVDGNSNPLNPFAFFVGFSPVAEAAGRASMAKGKKLDPLKLDLKPGSLVTFTGHPLYNSKHPAGIEGAYNAIIATGRAGPIGLRFFGDDGHAYDEARLRQRHVDAYNQPVDAVNALARESMRGVEAAYPDQITAADVPGLELLGHMDLQEGPWALLQDGPMAKVLPAYRKYLNHQLQGRIRLLPEDTLLPETVPNRRVYALSNEVLANREKVKLVFAHQGRLVSRKEAYTQVELPSAALTKEVRDALGLERRALRNLTEDTKAQLKAHPEMVLEPDLLDNRTLITLPKASFPKLEQILSGQAKG